MISILWADDQTDIVKTLSSVLSPISAKIVSVRDGNEAVLKLKREYFDVLLLDLKMPPGEWGGLWALEEIRKFNNRVPVIIISGEGTQNETIKGLRLGAQDYVTKDKVQIELLERVKSILQDNDRKVINDLTNHFPTPISFPYKRYINTSEPVARLHRLIEFFEAYLRFCCIIGMSELSLSGTSDIKAGAFRQLIQSPTMGIWNQSRQLITQHLQYQDSIFFRLNNPIQYDFAASLVKVRNDIAHGAEPSEAQASFQLKDFGEGLREFSKQLWQGINFEMIFPTRLQFDGQNFEVESTLISGNNSALPKLNIITPKPLISNQVHLMKKEDNIWLNLFPFIVLEPSDEPATWKIMVFDGLKMDRNIKNISGNESIRYIDITSGQRNLTPISHPVSRMLPSLVTS